MAYADLDQFKKWRKSSPSALAGLDIDLEEDDEMLELALESGAARIDSICRRTFELADDTPSERTFLTGDDGRYLFVDDYVGFAEVYSGGSLVSDAIAQTSSPGRPSSWLKGSFGRRTTVTMSARWGWPTIPAPVVTANLILAARFFELKAMPLGVLGQPEVGLMTGDAAERAARDLLSDYVKLRARFGR